MCVPYVQIKFSDIIYTYLIIIDLDRHELLQELIVFCQFISKIHTQFTPGEQGQKGRMSSEKVL